MGYLLFSTCFFLLGVATLAIIYRSRWVHILPPSIRDITLPGSNYIYSRLPSTFSADMENGFSSSTFDLAGNVASGDSRAGLDDSSKREIQKIMKNKRVGFDEARRIYTEGRFAKNNIGPDGRPRDPKFVSFS